MRDRREYQKQWRAKHPGYYAAKSKEFRLRNPLYMREWEAKHRAERKEYHVEWREERPGYFGEKSREYKLAHPGEHYERVKRYIKANPEKRKAHKIVHWALKTGRLSRLACEICANPKAHAHHSDYARPLEIKWLCALCHRREHAK